MGKKHHYEIVLNDGQNTCQPLTYNFGSTPKSNCIYHLKGHALYLSRVWFMILRNS